MGSVKKINNIVERVIRKNALGVIYNCPKSDQSIIVNKLIEKYKCIAIKGTDAFTSRMLQCRLGARLKIKNFTWQMLPMLEGKLVVINEADALKESYDKILIDFYKYKVPLLILMNGGTGMENLRGFQAYKRVFTIEQDYQKL